ncbi:MAG: helix-turn-helix domain-containing protein [Acidobacteria bacterium]|nr:helix-turn-helix domain-containing protein [Acidobacteriota bacterium]
MTDLGGVFRIAALRRQGLSQRQIAARLKLSKGVVQRAIGSLSA